MVCASNGERMWARLNLGHGTYHRIFQIPVSSGWSRPKLKFDYRQFVDEFDNLMYAPVQLGAPTNLCWELCTKTDARRQLPGCLVRGSPSHQPPKRHWILAKEANIRYWLHKSCKIEFTFQHPKLQKLIDIQAHVLWWEWICLSQCASFLRFCVSAKNSHPAWQQILPSRN